MNCHKFVQKYNYDHYPVNQNGNVFKIVKKNLFLELFQNYLVVIWEFPQMKSNKAQTQNTTKIPHFVEQETYPRKVPDLQHSQTFSDIQ